MEATSRRVSRRPASRCLLRQDHQSPACRTMRTHASTCAPLTRRHLYDESLSLFFGKPTALTHSGGGGHAAAQRNWRAQPARACPIGKHTRQHHAARESHHQYVPPYPHPLPCANGAQGGAQGALALLTPPELKFHRLPPPRRVQRARLLGRRWSGSAASDLAPPLPSESKSGCRVYWSLSRVCVERLPPLTACDAVQCPPKAVETGCGGVERQATNPCTCQDTVG